MLTIMSFNLASTSSKVQEYLIEFWLISIAEVATPPALAAFAGPTRTPFSKKYSVALAD